MIKELVSLQKLSLLDSWKKDLQDTKNYHNKRIREVEDKYKFGKVGKAKGKQSTNDDQKSGRALESERRLAEA